MPLSVSTDHHMPLSTHSVLVAVVALADDGDVTELALAESLSVSPTALSEPLETLCAFDLVRATETGYRPTITAYELLDAGIELDETLVVDFVEE